MIDHIFFNEKFTFDVCPGQRSGDLRARESSSGSSTDPSDGMKILSSYIGINDHLQGSKVDHGDLAPKVMSYHILRSITLIFNYSWQCRPTTN